MTYDVTDQRPNDHLGAEAQEGSHKYILEITFQLWKNKTDEKLHNGR